MPGALVASASRHMVRRPFVYEPGQVVRGTQLRIIRPLGYGGGGSVYEVEHLLLEKRYVIKVIHREYLAGRSRSEVEREARLLALLEHEHIVKILWADWTEDRQPLFYFAMEILDGCLLCDLIHWSNRESERLPIEFSVNTAASLFRALGYAHDSGVIHRDVKPENIVIHRAGGGSWVPKLIDFGIGKHVAEAKITHGFSGTYRYASPEQLDGQRATFASDIYSAGLVFYEMLVGHGPFADRANDMAIAEAHLKAEPPPLSRFVNIPAELEALVMGLLAKDPVQRGSKCRPIVEALERFQASRSPRPSSEPPQFSFLDEAKRRNERRTDDADFDSDSSSIPGAESRAASESLSNIHLVEPTVPHETTLRMPQATVRMPRRVASQEGLKPASVDRVNSEAVKQTSPVAPANAADVPELTARNTLKMRPQPAPWRGVDQAVGSLPSVDPPAVGPGSAGSISNRGGVQPQPASVLAVEPPPTSSARETDHEIPIVRPTAISTAQVQLLSTKRVHSEAVGSSGTRMAWFLASALFVASLAIVLAARTRAGGTSPSSERTVAVNQSPILKASESVGLEPAVRDLSPAVSALPVTPRSEAPPALARNGVAAPTPRAAGSRSLSRATSQPAGSAARVTVSAPAAVSTPARAPGVLRRSIY